MKDVLLKKYTLEEFMNKFEETVLERIYQSYVCGGDSLSFKLRNNKEADKIVKALENLESENYIEIVSKTEFNIKAAVKEKGINFGNSAI